MIDIDDLVRDFRSALAVPPLTSPAAVARTAIATPDTPSRVVVRWRRPLGLAFGGVATAGLATILGILFVAGGNSARTTSAPQVGWGLTVTLNVTADPGLDLQTTMTQVIQTLQARGTAKNIAGLSVTQTGPDQLSMQVPGAKWEADLVGLTDLTGIAAYRSTNILASGDNVRDLSGPDPGPITPATIFAFGPYPLPPDRDPFVGSESQVSKYAKQTGTDTTSADTLALPSNTQVLVRPGTGSGVRMTLARLILVADAPILRSGDVEALHVDGSRMIATIRPSERTRIQTALGHDANAPVVLTSGAGGGPRPIVGYLAPDPTASDGSQVVIDGDGEDPATLFENIFSHERPLDASVTVKSTTPYGGIPPIVGGHVALPTWLEKDRLKTLDYTSGAATAGFVEVPKASIVRVLIASGPDGPHSLWAGRAPDGSDDFWLAIDSQPGRSGASGACDPGVGAPLIRTCVNGFGSTGSVIVGRVAPQVGAVWRVLADGSRIDGTVKDGWFVIVGGPSTDHSTSMFAMDSSTGEIVAQTDERGWCLGPPPPGATYQSVPCR